MKNIVKTVSLLTIISLIPAAFAATSRVGVTNKASARLPSIAGHILSGGTTTTTTTATTASYYGVGDCVDNYRECMGADDVCGSNFEECTTNVLFHVQMPKCAGVLYQCTSAGVQQLFGTSAINALSAATYVKDSKGNDTQEVQDYTYPIQNSVARGWIDGAKSGNMLTKEQCIKRYTNCLKRDDVCGENFELCTSDKEFKKQAVLCDSTFARCDSDSKKELFGSLANAEVLNPKDVGDVPARLRTMITEGSQFAANNAVKTCNKVAKSCFVNACSKNPFRCVEGVKLDTIANADILGGGTDYSLTDTEDVTTAQSSSQVRRWFKAQCYETIGSNQYCHMTYFGKKPTLADLVDVDLQEDVFNQAYSDPVVKTAAQTQIQEIVKQFDTNAKNACVETIKSCAMRSCGGGLGSVCYRKASGSTFASGSGQSSQTFNNATLNNNMIAASAVPYNPGSSISSDSTLSVLGATFQLRSASTPASSYTSLNINGNNTYAEIQDGCQAIVNADPNCQYAASAYRDEEYIYGYTKDVFTTLFPSTAGSDPIGAIGKLNALLATSYNDAAIEKMKKQCENTALSCARSMCGEDYINCYRRRTDITAGNNTNGTGTYKTGNTTFNSSMNKVGGVLDYNIVIGLCLSTIKNSSVCEEHLKVATAEWRNQKYKDGDSWGKASSVGESWLNANATNVSEYKSEMIYDSDCGANKIKLGCTTNDAKNQNGRNLLSKEANDGSRDVCDGSVVKECGYVDEYGCIYDQPKCEDYSEYALENTATTLFQTVLRDEEMRVQKLYDAKLTKEQNICVNNNTGGIMGTTGAGSTFTWAKLRRSYVPGEYPSQGLKTNQFTSSNDLYGSFCLAKITVQSDDKDIQNLLADKQTAYFAVGDSFTCGSWISDADLRKISDTVGRRAVCQEGYGKWNSETGECDDKALSRKENIAYAWGTVAPMLAGGALGVGLTESGLLGGLTKGNTKVTTKKAKELCSDYAAKAQETGPNKNDYLKLARNYCNDVVGNCDSKEAFEIKTLCDAADANQADKLNDGLRAVIPIATSLGAGALGVGITASVIKQKKENIKNEAAQKWMDEIGEHIQCYLGTDELGTYGDVVSIELD